MFTWPTRGKIDAPVPCLCGEITQLPIFCPWCGDQMSRLQTYEDGRVQNFYKCANRKGETGCGHWDSWEGWTAQVRAYQASGARYERTNPDVGTASAEEQKKRGCRDLIDLLRFAEEKIQAEQAEVQLWKAEAQRWKGEWERQKVAFDALQPEVKLLGSQNRG
ncbi:hypothetical protein HMN09_01404500 [Mycena chlorophos]|uniref:Zinc finger GRF-type domain-containing protein n=1 Tax=Mycena chlorophos TaxID=658473 RepID=A0A8H6VSF6_MYCCL|nr:hypothetical protein HMN09_01404500 [Mycena chlorophos]